MRTLTYNTARVWDFVHQLTPVPLTAGMQGIGLERGGVLIAGALFEGFTGHNIWIHTAGAPGVQWLNRDFLRACFAYPFTQLECNRMSAWVEASNAKSRRFIEHIGFHREAVLERAAHDGGDVLLYVMWKEDCRHV